MGELLNCTFGCIVSSTMLTFYFGECEMWCHLDGIASIGRDDEVSAYVNKLMQSGTAMIDAQNNTLYVADNDGFINVNAALVQKGLVVMKALDKQRT